MARHVEDRDTLTEWLRREIVGPWPAGREVDAEGPITGLEPNDAGPFRQAGSGEEILTREPPTRRYGAGVLYPPREPDRDGNGEGDEARAESEEQDERHRVEPVRVTGADNDPPTERAREFEDDRDDFDLSSANRFRQSSMGLSLLAEIDTDSTIVVDVSGGRYERRTAPGFERPWWLRRPIENAIRFPAEDLLKESGGVAKKRLEGSGPLQLEVVIRVRPRLPAERLYLLTVSLVNRSQQTESEDAWRKDEACLFQSGFRVRIEGTAEAGAIHPYPEGVARAQDAEAASTDLLYRSQRTFAIGHGCAADWSDSPMGTLRERVDEVRAECLPSFETPSITPDVIATDNRPLTVRMAALAGLVDSEDGFESLQAVVDDYGVWIAERRREAGALPERYREAASRHLGQCEEALQRMRSGIDYLRSDQVAREAFALANRAMLMQWSRSRLPRREADVDPDEVRLIFKSPYPSLDMAALSGNPHSWRPFQIAFLLMTIGTVDDEADLFRETVELIWFPTGGGKTEAYLGLAAFHMFLRRLRDPAHGAVDVLMRYTLRLLTAQQFQRAATLIAAMEYLRRDREALLGAHPFSIGLWVGAGSTPNLRSEALKALRDLNQRKGRRNPFILLRCPWCQADMGPFNPRPRRKGAPAVIGYEQDGGTVALKCHDRACDFTDGLPVCVVDEDIYERRPSFVIATVDKFATLAWRPEARSLFGLGKDGARTGRPPGLIIQDELHLISGPLGSMVGLYEAVIEELCTDRRDGRAIRPKIVSSTATISRYREQIQALFGREEVTLFPPPGLDASDSFFGRYAKGDDGTALPGRRYVGIHAPGFGSLAAAQIRVYASMLQAPAEFEPEGRDPWWTLVVFFNSLRELGGAVSLVQSDVHDHIRTIRERVGIAWEKRRQVWRAEELTGRLHDHEVPAMLGSLAVSTTDSGRERPVDICLASSILEVGVDIERLSLMAVVGQPKTTAQYIQATGRVGRNWRERPSLILTLYSPSRPRDRSHFEHFRSYHQRLYAQVEPTSVTPFSPPALERALHAVMAIYARQAGDRNTTAASPHPYPEDLMRRLRDILRARIGAATDNDPEARDAFERVFNKRAHQWRGWERARWAGRIVADADIPLLRQAGAWASPEVKRLSWPTPRSLRNVDAECEGVITALYAVAAGGQT